MQVLNSYPKTNVNNTLNSSKKSFGVNLESESSKLFSFIQKKDPKYLNWVNEKTVDYYCGKRKDNQISSDDFVKFYSLNVLIRACGLKIKEDKSTAPRYMQLLKEYSKEAKMLIKELNSLRASHPDRFNIQRMAVNKSSEAESVASPFSLVA